MDNHLELKLLEDNFNAICQGVDFCSLRFGGMMPSMMSLFTHGVLGELP